MICFLTLYFQFRAIFYIIYIIISFSFKSRLETKIEVHNIIQIWNKIVIILFV